MSKYNQIKVLFTEVDRETLEPVLEQLRARSLRIIEGSDSIQKGDVVLAALSENFYADSTQSDRLLSLIGSGAESILPLQLDAAAIPDTLKNALYARNIIPAAGREPGQIAERILSALPKKKNRLPLFLVLAAVVLALVAGMMFWRSSRPIPVEETPVPVPEEPEPTELSIAIPAGLTAEELAEVKCVVIVGEHFSYYTEQTRLRRPEGGNNWPDMLFELANADQQEGSGTFDWFWHEDGSRVDMAPYDLSFLAYMPNLEELHMAMVDLETVPDLSGLEHLNVVWALECRMDDLSWLSGSSIRKAQLRCDVDYSPLGGNERLRYAILDVLSERGADFSRFSPPQLREFDLVCWNLDSIDLSGLSRCGQLQNVRLSGVPVRDLSFLEGKNRLSEVRLNQMRHLRDISAIGSLTSIGTIDIDGCEGIADLSPLAGCSGVNSFRYRSDDVGVLRDASFLAGMSRLRTIELGNVDLPDIDFLKELGVEQRAMEFSFAGNIDDLSGLAACKNFQRLSLDPDPAFGVRLDEIVPYLEGAVIQNLALRRFSGLDLSILPDVKDQLELDRCDITDLSALPGNLSATRIHLNKLSVLRSLEGLQNLSRFRAVSGNLTIYACPRLVDWSAIDGMKLYSLEIIGGFTLPSFKDLQVGALRLDSVAEVADLHFLDEMDASAPCSFTLVGLEELKSLEPLSRFHGGYLAVQPQLLEQAEDLVASGNFRTCRAEYPQGGWEMDDLDFSLLSLEELETLPKALLRRVSRLCIAGDTVVDPERFDIWENWENNKPIPILHDRNTGEETTLEPGSFENLDALAALTGLKQLQLYYQPLESLDGVQVFSELEWLSVAYCDRLTDASAAFTLQNLHAFSIRATAVDSIQGIQNLPQLEQIDLFRTEVKDLSPLKECDFRFAAERRGLNLQLEANGDRLEYENLDALSVIPRFDWLCLNGIDATSWLPYLESAPIRAFSATDAFNDETFSSFIQSHPDLEELHIPWNEEIHDLTGLLDMPNLRYVRISFPMKEAIRSLDGQSYGFELEIEGQ